MQGINRYVPPTLEGTTTGNKLHQRRAPGTLRKDGTQTVRFELPFAVWCHHCVPHAIIGQGVRFNATKSKVGYYHSTPIWSFGIKHTACGGALEIRTDPQHTAYVVTAGGKARDYGSQETVREGEGGIPILTAAERERRREDAFAALEGRKGEEGVVREAGKRVEELWRGRERDWECPGRANERVRRGFRRERKERRREEEATEALKGRLGTDMEVLPESEEDGRRARLVSFGVAETGGENAAEYKALFERRTQLRSRSVNGKPSRESPGEVLRRQLVGHTRAAVNPFGGLRRA